MRLSTKIPLVVFLGCLAAGAIGSAFLAAGLASEVRDAFERRSAGLVGSLAAMGASPMATEPPGDVELQQAVDNLEEFGHGLAHGIEWIAFVDCRARIVAHSDPRRYATPVREVDPSWLRCDAPAVPPRSGDPAAPDLAGMKYEGDRLVLAAPVRLETRFGTVVASFSLADVAAQEAAGRRRAFLYVTGLAAILAVALSLLLRTTVARRLSRLSDDTAALRQGDLDRRSVVSGADEVGQLARAFNAMAERLARHARDLEDQVKARTRQLEDANRELERLATTDALTGLLNRRRLQEVLAAALEHHRRKGRTLSVVMIDLDYFKGFNDTRGHLAGDDVLRALGERLRTRTRAADSAGRVGTDWAPAGPDAADAAAARYGGEEFVLVLPETAKADALRVAERVRSSAETEPLGPGPDGRVTLSAGVASFPEDADGLDGLLRAADDALYAAKHAGRNRVCAAPAAPPPEVRSAGPEPPAAGSRPR
jgi:GGDEF domain-containing protein/HAMP domain-containing protein